MVSESMKETAAVAGVSGAVVAISHIETAHNLTGLGTAILGFCYVAAKLYFFVREKLKQEKEDTKL